ncbi:preprotein translocase subunit SecA [Patescibacteria group bacterium]|nr:preprotein translocase subunit SecA [Patescibacteria group bacterium]MBU1931475.1 preprotein translocase subunit SecA [Patescibacteria group bacterium]
MVLKFLSRFLDTNIRQLKKFEPMVVAINQLEPKTKKLKKSEFKAKTEEFKLRLERGDAPDDVLVDAFALAREAAHRTIGLRLYDEQLLAAICFHKGMIAEQKTGEGKTLSAVPALYLNALKSKGCHLVTVNDYLARRDTGWNGPIFSLLGLSVGCIIHDQAFLYDYKHADKSAQDERLAHLRPVERRQAYAADITYGTNNEFGFDYLRDNMVQALEQQVQRGHNFAIVDEVDSILIDEARTPLIISAPDVEPTQKYYQFAQLIGTLSPDTDYEIDEKLKTATLTEHGLRKTEKKLGIENLYEKDFDTIHHIENALKAKTLYSKDRDYVVKEGQVIIVDEFTGRLMHGRRWSDGLHQSVEAKEGVGIQQESKTLATISFQNYFRLYEKLAGMTGTAATEAEEFRRIYELNTVVVPTHEPVIRADHTDAVYKTTRAKYAAIVEEVAQLNKKGQPVLIGTTSISKNQIIANFLKRKKIPHNVLNAKNHLKEAQIIAQAGKVGGITVATNMAGRGVDIILGGDSAGRDKKDWQKEHDRVIKLGGLHVIGTERHESRRIDNQLRGRSGRQGDPGSSRFYVALDDDIMRLFGGEQVAKLMGIFKMPEDVPLEHSMVSKAIEQAQVKVEGFHFDSRKHLVEYDDVMNKQREIIYQRRKQLLNVDPQVSDLKDKLLLLVDNEITSLVNLYAPEGFTQKEIEKLVMEFCHIIPFNSQSQKKLTDRLVQLKSAQKLTAEFKQLVRQTYRQRETTLTPEVMREAERFVFLSTIDRLWIDHLDAVENLREGIGLRGYAQQDPLVEYKSEAFTMFEQLVGKIDYEIIRRIFRVEVAAQPTAMPQEAIEGRGEEIAPEKPGKAPKADRHGRPAVEAPVGVQAAAPMAPLPGQGFVKPIVSGKKKVGRNDPCPCGAVNPQTGKPYKYKKCGLIVAPHHRK